MANSKYKPTCILCNDVIERAASKEPAVLLADAIRQSICGRCLKTFKEFATQGAGDCTSQKIQIS